LGFVEQIGRIVGECIVSVEELHLGKRRVKRGIGLHFPPAQDAAGMLMLDLPGVDAQRLKQPFHIRRYIEPVRKAAELIWQN
jgi:hypothetical protein